MTCWCGLPEYKTLQRVTFCVPVEKSVTSAGYRASGRGYATSPAVLRRFSCGLYILHVRVLSAHAQDRARRILQSVPVHADAGDQLHRDRQRRLGRQQAGRAVHRRTLPGHQREQPAVEFPAKHDHPLYRSASGARSQHGEILDQLSPSSTSRTTIRPPVRTTRLRTSKRSASTSRSCPHCVRGG